MQWKFSASVSVPPEMSVIPFSVVYTFFSHCVQFMMCTLFFHWSLSRHFGHQADRHSWCYSLCIQIILFYSSIAHDALSRDLTAMMLCHMITLPWAMWSHCHDALSHDHTAMMFCFMILLPWHSATWSHCHDALPRDSTVMILILTVSPRGAVNEGRSMDWILWHCEPK